MVLFQIDPIPSFISPQLPVWVLVILAFLWGFKVYLLPIFKEYLASKTQNLKELKEQHNELLGKYEKLSKECTKMKGDFDLLRGRVDGFNVYLKSNGLEKIPPIDDN